MPWSRCKPGGSAWGLMEGQGDPPALVALPRPAESLREHTPQRGPRLAHIPLPEVQGWALGGLGLYLLDEEQPAESRKARRASSQLWSWRPRPLGWDLGAKGRLEQGGTGG